MLSEESYNPLGNLDCHGDGAYGEKCRAVFGDGDVEYQGHEETHEEEGVYEKRLVVATEMYYESLYKHLTEGAELAVKPEWAAQTISIIETAHAQNPLPVKF